MRIIEPSAVLMRDFDGERRTPADETGSQNDS